MNSRKSRGGAVLVHLASGIGNIVLATPLLLVLERHGYAVDVLVDGDYHGTADLFAEWSAVQRVYDGRNHLAPTGAYDFRLPAIPPFYWKRYAARYRPFANSVPRPPDALFYCDEQAYYLEFARTIGCDVSEAPYYFVPVGPATDGSIGTSSLALAPGCKTGSMAVKRWPHFPELAELFDDVFLVGSPEDLFRFDGTPMRFPSHVRSLVGELSLRETAVVLASAGAVVANDSGLGHLAGAAGTATVLLFGPTPHRTLGRFPPNVTVLRAGLPCEPCWLSSPLAACKGRIDCLQQLSIEFVCAALHASSSASERRSLRA